MADQMRDLAIIGPLWPKLTSVGFHFPDLPEGSQLTPNFPDFHRFARIDLDRPQLALV